MHPVKLAPNPIEHFYLGGERIAKLRGTPLLSARSPEEWVGATVSRAGSETLGLSRTVDGALLRDLVSAQRSAWFGSEFSPSHPADTGILLKLLDAGQRLPVHVHPNREFARDHLDCPYGKTEAWFVLEADEGANFYLGWNTDVDPDELALRRDAQDSDWMLDHMNKVPAVSGRGVLVPAGQVHAIDGGIFVAEAQEPSDFSILLEWSITTSNREESHLGLGFDRVMPAVSHARLPESRLRQLVVDTDISVFEATTSLLPAEGDSFFRLDGVADGGVCEAGFALLIVLSGSGLARGDSAEFEVSAGDSWAIPADFGRWQLAGDARVLVARPGSGWPHSV